MRINYTDVIAKFDHTYDTENFRYLMKNIVGFEVNLELMLVQLTVSSREKIFLFRLYDISYNDFTLNYNIYNT